MVVYSVFEWNSKELREVIEKDTGAEALQYGQIGVFSTYKKAKKAVKIAKRYNKSNSAYKSHFTIEPLELNAFCYDDKDEIIRVDLNDAS